MSLFPRYHSHSNHHGSGSGASAMSPFWRLLEDPFFVPSATSGGRTGGLFQPKFDVHETPESFVLDGEVPGITDKNALDIHFADQQTLVIHGRVEKLRRSSPDSEAEDNEQGTTSDASSKQPTVEDDGTEGETASKAANTQLTSTTGETGVAKSTATKHRVWVQERSVGEFQRSFNFPAGIDQDNVKASLKDGILTVTVPKMAQKGKRRINID